MTTMMTNTPTTRCKFTCQSVTKSKHYRRDEPGFLFTARFVPVTSGSEENQKFFDATPSGSLEVGTYVDDRFVVGKDYYLDITLAEE